MKKGNIVLIIVCLAIVILGFVFMPSIYRVMTDFTMDKKIEKVAEKNKTKEKKNEITLESDVVKELVYPVMHNNLSNTDSYYKLAEFKISSMTNNDILYNAFLQIYSGYLVNEGEKQCTNNSVSFDANYIELRIKNIFGTDTGYNLTDFTVPSGSNSNYIGTFKYNKLNNTYTYYGECNKSNNSTKYYEILEPYDVQISNDDNLLNIYYHIGFIKVQGNKYELYKDYNYTEQISSGNFINNDDIAKMLAKLGSYKYQYVFRKDTCNYDSYCFYEGKWIK